VLSRFLYADRESEKRMQGPTRGLVMLGLGLLLALSAAVADAYLHRGIETSSDPPYVMHVSGRGTASNVDLRTFSTAQIETVASTLRANGLQFVRHPFAWSEIEPTEGEYDWERYDALVRSFSDAGIEIIAVVGETPAWARSEEMQGALDAPPLRPEAYANFVAELVERYGQYIRFFQIGDRPNVPERWGGESARPAEYLSLLAPTFNAVRTANPDARIILAEFDPYGGGSRMGDDLRFLEAVYEGGGAAYFDVVAAQVDGGTASPYDRRMNAATPSLSRATLFRELVHRFGDDEKPIWFTRYGWDGQESVGRDTQAEYIIAGIERVRTEWPWVGLVFQWGLRPESVEPERAGMALLNPDGTATPAFLAVAELAETGVGSIASTGFIPTDSGPIEYVGTWASQHLSGQEFQTTSQVGASLAIDFEGTGLVGYLRRGPDAGLIYASIDGKPLPGWPEIEGRSVIDLEFYQAQDIRVSLADGLEDGRHELILELGTPGRFTIGGMVVSRDPPLRWPIVLALVSALVLIGVAMREILIFIGRFSGAFAASSESGSEPRLPSMPDWRPSLRT
jgi:polysaccharide biosynthesis protein PslG